MTAVQAYLADVGIKMTYPQAGRRRRRPVERAAETMETPAAVTWDIAYGAKAALVLHEYYNVYLEGKASLRAAAPANATS